MPLRDQMALQFASSLARDDEDVRAVAQRAYELADAMLTRRRELDRTARELDLDEELPYRSQGLAPVGDDPRGLEPAPLGWILQPTWTQIPLFQREGLLDDAPAPPSERDFGEPEDEVPAPPSERDYDPRWEAKPQWSGASPGLARTRPADIPKKATG